MNPQPKISPRPDLRGEWYELTEDFCIPIPLTKYAIKIRKGFLTDGASIPKFMWFSIGHPFSPRLVAGAVPHDAIYRSRIVAKRKGDVWFVRLIRNDGLSRWDSIKCYAGLVLAGWYSWMSKTKEEIEEAKKFVSLERTDS